MAWPEDVNKLKKMFKGKPARNVLRYFDKKYDDLIMHDDPPGKLKAISFVVPGKTGRTNVTVHLRYDATLFSVERKWHIDAIERAIVHDLILPGWEQASHWERFRAVDRCRTPDKIPVLFRCLMDRDPEIRGLAGYALNELEHEVRDYLNLPEFISVLDSPEDEIRAAAIGALSYLSTKVNSQAVQIAMAAVADPGVRTQAVAAGFLGVVESLDGMGPLITALDEPCHCSRNQRMASRAH